MGCLAKTLWGEVEVDQDKPANPLMLLLIVPETDEYHGVVRCSHTHRLCDAGQVALFLWVSLPICMWIWQLRCRDSMGIPQQTLQSTWHIVGPLFLSIIEGFLTNWLSMQWNIMKLSQLTNSKVLKQNTHTHTHTSTFENAQCEKYKTRVRPWCNYRKI